MKKEKLKLDELKVQSFITDLDMNAQQKVVGATGIECAITPVSDLLGCHINGISQGANICTRDSC